MLEGTFELWVDERHHVLGPGDSFEFQSGRPHRFGNPGDIPTKLIWVLTPPLYQGRTRTEKEIGDV
ncbi:cupin domain-containing protein [Bradyrhizobium jicamae]|uniref:cupin domain-containing protein n=1 Tax=Bradyrhizobium jicamae TaxID=280332 RepID=UPI003907EFBF